MSDNNGSLDHDMLDIDFISSQSSTSSTSLRLPRLSSASERVLIYIDDTFELVIDALLADSDEGLNPEVVLKRVTNSEKQSVHHDNGVEAANEYAQRTVTHRPVTYDWPGKTERKAWQFTCLLAVLFEIKVAIEDGITVTKRDIYYRQPELFGKQEIVDRFVDDIAFTCGVARKDLRVTASPKGLCCGLNTDDCVLIVPEELSYITPTTVSHLQWILVIEKEASFKNLVEHAMQRSNVIGHGLIVTGKGYPDLNTKRFLRHVCDMTSSSIPIFGLCDGDPDGLDIYRCYRSGSKRLIQESSCNLQEISWLGIDMSNFLGSPLIMNAALSLTVRDRGKAKSMLQRDNLEMPSEHNESVTRIRRMLQIMLMLNLKMEIQAVEHIDGGLYNWLVQSILKAS